MADVNALWRLFQSATSFAERSEALAALADCPPARIFKLLSSRLQIVDRESAFNTDQSRCWWGVAEVEGGEFKNVVSLHVLVDPTIRVSLLDAYSVVHIERVPFGYHCRGELIGSVHSYKKSGTEQFLRNGDDWLRQDIERALPRPSHYTIYGTLTKRCVWNGDEIGMSELTTRLFGDDTRAVEAARKVVSLSTDKELDIEKSLFQPLTTRLADLVQSGNDELVVAAMKALASVGCDVQDHVPSLVDLVSHESAPVRRQAIESAGRICGHEWPPDLKSAVLNAVRDPDATVRRTAAKVSGYLDCMESIVEVLTVIEHERDDEVREGHLMTLRRVCPEFKHDGLVPIFTRFLQSPFADIRLFGAASLGFYRQSIAGAKEELHKLAEQDPERINREVAKRTLAKLVDLERP